MTDSVHSANAEAGRVHQWQPIETAPKDGTVILVWRYYPCAVMWVGGEEWQWLAMPIGAQYAPFVENGFMAHDRAVTHWMPLPPAPEAA